MEPFRFILRENLIESVPSRFVLLKPVVAGVCGSEILYFKGEKEKEKLESRLPMCLLHEGVAEVIATGEGADLKTGTYVVVNPMQPCGRCISCKLGIGENYCQNSKYMAATADGLSRTRFLYPEARVLPVPEGVELEIAALSEPISIALNALEVAGVSKGENVAVIGDGPIGYLIALATSYIRKVPRENLHLIGIVDEKLSLARDFSDIVNSLREGRRLEELQQTLDVVFEAVGGRAQESTLDEAINLLRPGGRCVVLGLYGKKVPVDVAAVVNKGLRLIGSVRSRMEHFRQTIELLRNSEFRDKVRRIISGKRFVIRSPEDLEAAFRYADTEEGEARTKPGRVLVYFP
ncbi:MAG: zinc-binding dehydrogenase [Candidatus Bathyarchaeia archaeon]